MFKDYREPSREEPARGWHGGWSWKRIAAALITALLVTGCLIVNFEDLALRGL